MEKRLVRIILSAIEFGPKPRYSLTNRLKNYGKDRRLAAISYCMDNKLVHLQEVELKNNPGRNPVFVEITESGLEFLESIRGEIDDNSVWCQR